MKKNRLTFAIGLTATILAAGICSGAQLPSATYCTNSVQTILSIASTNVAKAQTYFNETGISGFYLGSRSELTLWIDNQLGPIGIMLNYMRCTEATSAKTPFPKMANNTFSNSNIEVVFPEFTKVARKYGIDMRAYSLSVATLSEVVTVFNEYLSLKNLNLSNGYVSSVSDVSDLKRLILVKSVAVVKRYLRDNGKSFVTVGNVNPLEGPINELTTALNAARLAGVNEWFSKYGADASIDTTKLPDDEQLTKLKNELLYGEKNIDEKAKYVLFLCLGVNGYNEFVRQYNGN